MISSGWNLPPGCYESDLPGNSPEDLAFDGFLDTEAFDRVAGDGDQAIEDAFRAWMRGEYESED